MQPLIVTEFNEPEDYVPCILKGRKLEPLYHFPFQYEIEGFHDYPELLPCGIFGFHETTSMIWKTTFRMLFMYLFLLIIFTSWCSSSVMAWISLPISYEI